MQEIQSGSPASCIGLPRGWYIFWCFAVHWCIGASCKSRDSLEALLLEMGKLQCSHTSFHVRDPACMEAKAVTAGFPAVPAMAAAEGGCRRSMAIRVVHLRSYDPRSGFKSTGSRYYGIRRFRVRRRVVSSSHNLLESFSNSRLESICGMLIGLEAEGLEEGPWCAWSFISLLLVLWWTCVKTSGTST